MGVTSDMLYVVGFGCLFCFLFFLVCFRLQCVPDSSACMRVSPVSRGEFWLFFLCFQLGHRFVLKLVPSLMCGLLAFVRHKTDFEFGVPVLHCCLSST